MKAKVLPLLSMSTAGEICVKTLLVSLLEAMSRGRLGQSAKLVLNTCQISDCLACWQAGCCKLAFANPLEHNLEAYMTLYSCTPADLIITECTHEEAGSRAVFTEVTRSSLLTENWIPRTGLASHQSLPASAAEV